VRYAEFRDRLENSLLDAGLMIRSGLPSAETIDLGDSVRHWKAWIIGITSPSTKPFDVSADISFEWYPVDAARAHTCEEDLLTALLGRRRESAKTQPRWTRVDLSLRASLPYGSTTSMPEPHLFGPWSTSVVDKVGAALTDVKERKGNIVAILGGHRDLEVEGHCGSDGVVSLTGLAISGFRMVRVPRVWDDPERREAEWDAADALARLARTFKATFDEWTKSVSELATWIRYAPPPSNAKPIEPWFDDQSEDDDGGPETIH